MALIHIIVEGDLDEAIANRLIVTTGHEPGTCYPKKGFSYIERKISEFNKTAVSINYLALVDFMDTRQPCPGAVVASWLPHRQPRMLLRVVVREIESWLLADRENIAHFLGAALSKIPAQPEAIEDPKQTLINLARAYASKQIRESLVPREGSTATEGTLYNSELLRFIHHNWDIAKARRNAPSLDRCYQRLKTLP